MSFHGEPIQNQAIVPHDDLWTTRLRNLGQVFVDAVENDQSPVVRNRWIEIANILAILNEAARDLENRWQMQVRTAVDLTQIGQVRVELNDSHNSTTQATGNYVKTGRDNSVIDALQNFAFASNIGRTFDQGA